VKIGISEQVLKMFPEFTRGVLVARDINNHGEDENLSKEMEELLKTTRRDKTLRDYKSHPKIASWRDAFQRFSVNPNACPPSIANLVKRTVGGAKLPFISKVVTIFNIMSLKHILPLGGDDLESVVGDLRLEVAKGDEIYIPLGKPNIVEHPTPGEIVYFDSGDKKVLCRAWCWRNSEITKILPETSSVAINVDGLPPIGQEQVIEIMGELAEKIEKHCGGSTTPYVLSNQNPWFEI